MKAVGVQRFTCGRDRRWEGEGRGQGVLGSAPLLAEKTVGLIDKATSLLAIFI
jgi:hypothetical protein